jgi:RNA polymerase sigma-70 factor (ECF subfamily)
MVAPVLVKQDTLSIEGLIANGDHRDAISRCAEEHGPVIGRLCMALLGSQADAEEVLQETLVAADKGMARYRGDGSVKSWLFGIARRQCAKRLTTVAKNQRKLQLVPDKTPSDGPETNASNRQRSATIRAALDKLKPSERDVVVLRYQAGLSYREIAKACGIDEAAARKRASRALARLRTVLSVEDVQ